MVESFCCPGGASNEKVPWIAFLIVSTAVLCTGSMWGQTSPSAAAAPVDPAAAAGMTSGMPNGLTGQRIEMMQVRTAAQSAQGDAAAAAMARSAGQAIDDRNEERALQSARELKSIKRQMADRMKWERASSSSGRVNKVSANEMASWRTDSGNVRVERNVPDPFIASLIEEEQQIAAREQAERERQGFAPLQATRDATMKALSWRPFQGGRNQEYVNDPYASTASATLPSPEVSSGGGGGFFKKLRVPKNNQAVSAADAGSAEPRFVQTSSSVGASSGAPAPAPAQAASRPGMVPRISGAALIDGASPVNEREAAPQAASPGNQTSAPVEPVSFSSSLPDESGGQGGFFSKLKGNGNSGGSSGGGFLGFGKKKQESSEGGTIDAALFPAGSVAQAPTGSNLSGSYTPQEVAEESYSAPSSTGSFALPGEAPEKKKGFSLSMPNISIPSIGQSGSSSGGGGRSVPTMTTINSAGNDYYVITGNAQFMVYGSDAMESEVRALRPGTIVRMTKPGENWASISLPDGTSGVVQNSFLRAASATEAGGSFAVSN
ncbi:MAG: hypothetical protein AAGC68_05840 [Verrucomicrobiota bacterium]